MSKNFNFPLNVTSLKIKQRCNILDLKNELKLQLALKRYKYFKIKQQRDILDLKNELKHQLAPKRYKFLSGGDKRGNNLLTQIRIAYR